jgi:hypothetical protein
MFDKAPAVVGFDCNFECLKSIKIAIGSGDTVDFVLGDYELNDKTLKFKIGNQGVAAAVEAQCTAVEIAAGADESKAIHFALDGKSMTRRCPAGVDGGEAITLTFTNKVVRHYHNNMIQQFEEVDPQPDVSSEIINFAAEKIDGPI